MPTSFDDETLVAYLDGELPSNDVVAIEQQLVQDEPLRARLTSLKVSWDLLVELPDQKPNPDLAQSTIELLAVQLEDQPKTWRRWLATNAWIPVCVGCAATLALGTMAGSAYGLLQEAQFLDSLPAIVEYRSLKNVDSIEWLEKLATIEHLIESGEGRGPKSIGSGQVPPTNQERRAWLESLGDLDRGRLADNNGEYDDYRERQEKDRSNDVLREIADWIYDDKQDTSHLLKTIRAYSAVLDEAGTMQITHLMAEPDIEQRRRNLEQRVARVMLSNYADNMPEDDQDAIREWILQLQIDDDDFNFRDVEFYVWELSGDPEESEVSEEQTTNLIQSMSLRAQNMLKLLSSNETRRDVIRLWVVSIMLPESSAGDVTVDQLRATFDRLPEDQQGQLELLPEDEAISRLRQYMGAPNSLESAPNNDPNVLQD